MSSCKQQFLNHVNQIEKIAKVTGPRSSYILRKKLKEIDYQAKSRNLKSRGTNYIEMPKLSEIAMMKHEDIIFFLVTLQISPYYSLDYYFLQNYLSKSEGLSHLLYLKFTNDR